MVLELNRTQNEIDKPQFQESKTKGTDPPKGKCCFARRNSYKPNESAVRRTKDATGTEAGAFFSILLTTIPLSKP
jgi:hypothetical protein